MSDLNIWAQVLERLRADLDPEEFRRWFASTAYASDSGDQITVWVGSDAEGRHIRQNYYERLRRELDRLGRPDTHIRLVSAGYADEDEDDDHAG